MPPETQTTRKRPQDPNAPRRTTGKRQAPRASSAKGQTTRQGSRPPQRRRRKKKQNIPYQPIILGLVLLVILGIVLNLTNFGQVGKLAKLHVPGWVDKQIISETAGGRPGIELDGVKDIAIHYVANPGSTAQNNHDYFDQPETQVSAHFIVGLEGEIIQCIPLNEMSYATNDRNNDTISIEVCHPDETGQFNQATYDALVKLTAWLCDNCGISRKDVIRHYDVTGKACPLYFVDHPDAWEQFLKDVKQY